MSTLSLSWIRNHHTVTGYLHTVTGNVHTVTELIWESPPQLPWNKELIVSLFLPQSRTWGCQSGSVELHLATELGRSCPCPSTAAVLQNLPAQSE